MYEIYARFRDAMGMTDYAVSKLTGISRSTLSEWKSGKHNADTATLYRLSKLLGTTVEVLSGEEPSGVGPSGNDVQGTTTKSSNSSTVDLDDEASSKKVIDSTLNAKAAHSSSADGLSSRARMVATAFDASDELTQAMILRLIGLEMLAKASPAKNR